MKLIHSLSDKDEIILITENDVVQDVRIELPDTLRPDTICLARALKSIAGGWFVEIGNHTAFLQTPKTFLRVDGFPNTLPLSEGERLIVQVQHEATEDKNLKVSADITIASEYIVYTPARNGIAFSREITESQKTTLLSALQNHSNSATESFTVRSAAIGAESNHVIEDLKELRHLWQAVLAESAAYQPVLWEPDRTVFQLAKQYEKELNEIVTDNAQTALGLKSRFDFTRLCLNNLREQETVNQLIEEALDQKSDLPCGGSVIVERTAAIVCFDVNAGKASWAEANRQAVKEIVRQIRIKGLSGQMIIDFAGKKEKGEIRKLGGLLGQADVSLRIWGVSNLGLLELTKRRSTACLLDAKGYQK